jgi:ATP-dependent Clp protease ATP-binding subunit ClpB
MVRLNKKLDPRQTGREADKLYRDLQRRIVGQDEAIDQIVNIYQTYLAGMNSPGGRSATSCSSAPPVPAKLAW